ncbi:MAG: methyl-accepting chemotaxis protein [Clostridia bacterium]|nr:methyl-accepting chemotaxis protein [Clostridia bacterium]
MENFLVHTLRRPSLERGEIMSKQNCWEVMGCPDDRRSRCPAYTEGKGRRCWRTQGTFCQGEAERNMVNKLLSCLDCKAYHEINRVNWYNSTYFNFALCVTSPVLAVFAGFIAMDRLFLQEASPELYFGLVLVSAALLTALTMAPAYQMMKPLNIIRNKLREIGTGNLASGAAMVPRRDEYMLLAIALNDLKEVLKGTVEAIASNTAILRKSTDQLIENTESTAAGAEDTAGTIGQMAATTDSISENVSQLAVGAKTASAHAADGRKFMIELKNSMGAIEGATRNTARAIQELSAKSGEIGNITQLITQIADQTNLLALNAAIEAARAGVHGRGFAVVADEVRNLAEQSGEAASNIRKLIDVTRASTEQTATVMAQGQEQVKAGAAVLGRVDQSFQEIALRVQDLTEKLQSVAAATEEMSGAMNNVAATTQEQSAATQEITASAQMLANLSEESALMVSRFRLS